MSQYGIIKEPLTKEQIQWIRKEMDEGSSLRRLASDFVQEFGKYKEFADNQILGMDLCAEANYDWQS